MDVIGSCDKRIDQVTSDFVKNRAYEGCQRPARKGVCQAKRDLAGTCTPLIVSLAQRRKLPTALQMLKGPLDQLHMHRTIGFVPIGRRETLT